MKFRGSAQQSAAHFVPGADPHIEPEPTQHTTDTGRLLVMDDEQTVADLSS